VANPDPCADHDQHDPLVGGITISSLTAAPSGGGIGMGTLGFFVTLNGETAPKNIAAVTCAHVVTESGNGMGDTFYQPAFGEQPDGRWLPDPLHGADSSHSAQTVGNVLRLPTEHADANGFFVDAAAIKLDICISSCCNSNCGVSFTHTILALNVANSNDVVDVSTSVAVGDTVYKVGRRTGRTVGRVSGVMIPRPEGLVIEVSPVSMQDPTTNCNGNLRFADHGDSGSALIDAQGRLIGLVYAIDAPTRTLGFACYITPVLTALNSVAVTRNNPVHGNPAASGMMAELPAIIDGKPNLTPELRARVLASERGRYFWRLVDGHRLEAIHLVNHNRRVTVAWHRHQGPAFLNRLMANARDPDEPIPRVIEGVSRADLLRAMAQAFRAHGSPALRAAVDRHYDEALSVVDAGDNLHVLVELLDDERKSA
jgi:hypothetical protein